MFPHHGSKGAYFGRETGKSGQSVPTSLLPGAQRSPWLPLQACNDVCFLPLYGGAAAILGPFELNGRVSFLSSGEEKSLSTQHLPGYLPLPSPCLPDPDCRLPLIFRGSVCHLLPLACLDNVLPSFLIRRSLFLGTPSSLGIIPSQ